MNCRRAKKLIYDFIDGVCDETVQIELERHLSDCEACDQLASGLTRSLDLLKRAPVETVNDNFGWRVRLAIRKELAGARELGTSQRGLFRSWNVGYAASAVAGFAVMLVAGWIAIGSVDNPIGAGSLDGLTLGDKQTTERPSNPPAQSEFVPSGSGSPTVTVGENGGALSKSEDSAVGAFDRAIPANRDSLVSEAVKGMTPEEQMQFLRKQIIELQVQIENRTTKKR